MSDNCKQTPDGSPPEDRDFDCHEITQAIQSIVKVQLEPSHITKTKQSHAVEREVPEIGHDVTLDLARAAGPRIKTSADVAEDSLPIENTHHKHLSSPSKAMEAFHIPEIAENILKRLIPEDLLRTTQIDRKIFNIIHDSPLLRRNLFLEPRLTGPFEMFPSTLDVGVSTMMWPRSLGPDPLYSRVTSTVNEWVTSNSMFLSIESDVRLAEGRVGARVASMFVCQPPVYVMQVSIPHCDSWKLEQPTPADTCERFTLKAKNGIKIGHMVDAIKNIRESHSSCDPLTMHGDDAENHWADRVWPEFETIITLEHDDPLFAKGKNALNGGYNSEQDQNEAENMMSM